MLCVLSNYIMGIANVPNVRTGTPIHPAGLSLVTAGVSVRISHNSDIEQHKGSFLKLYNFGRRDRFFEFSGAECSGVGSKVFPSNSGILFSGDRIELIFDAIEIALQKL